MKTMSEIFRVKPGKKIRLKDYDPDMSGGYSNKTAALADLEKNVQRLGKLEYLLYADGSRALLIVLQALDAGGKDGTIRHVMTGLNPQSCKVTSFKTPTTEELKHDFLWRIHKAVPGYGEIGIFNRSHYEDVLVVRVHKLVAKEVWSTRYDQINAFEKMLTDNRVTMLKFFLHISKDEQKKRFQARIDDPDRQWKISEADFKERSYWADYTQAYEEAISRCSTDYAPWFIIPSNKKWFRNLAVSRIIVETMEAMKLKFPLPSFDISKLKWK
jgi:PPK2 family polyphosphate:nucleotide phosphotransferase